MTARSQFGIGLPHGWWTNEWEETARPARGGAPTMSDNDAKERVVLFGPKGEALVREVPRPVGFRRP